MSRQTSSVGRDRIRRCQDTLAARRADRAATYVPAIACEVSSQILGRPAVTGTGSLHFAEVAAWSQGQRAHSEFEQRLIQDLIAVHRALDVDVLRMPWRMNRRPAARIDEHTFVFGDPQGVHEIWQYNPDSADFGPVRRVGRLPPPERSRRQDSHQARRDDPSGLRLVAEQLRGLRALREAAGGEFFVIGAAGMITAGLGQDDLLLLGLQPQLVAGRAMLQARRAVDLGEALTASELPPVILGGGDLAGRAGPMYSPATFREVMLPAYSWAMQRLNALGVHYCFRSDGNIWPLMDMLFAQAGCPGFGEADRDAGMRLGTVRQRFGKLVIWGNVSSVTLTHGTPGQVHEECRRILDESGGAAYFHGCSNAIIKGTPPANVEAMLSVR